MSKVAVFTTENLTGSLTLKSWLDGTVIPLAPDGKSVKSFKHHFVPAGEK